MELHELQVAQHRARPAARRRCRRPSPAAGWSRTGTPARSRRSPARRRGRGRRRRRPGCPSPRRAGSRRRPAPRPVRLAGVGRARQHVEDERVLDDLDARVVAHGLELRDQRAGDLRARGVAAGVRDAVGVVAALAGERDLAVGRRCRRRAPSATSSRTRAGPSVTSTSTARGVADAAAGGERVLQVRAGRVRRVRAPRRCRPAPRPSSPDDSAPLVTSRTRGTRVRSSSAAVRPGDARSRRRRRRPRRSSRARARRGGSAQARAGRGHARPAPSAPGRRAGTARSARPLGSRP